MEDPDSSNVNESFWHRFVGTLGQVLHELKAPPTIATVSSFNFLTEFLLMKMLQPFLYLEILTPFLNCQFSGFVFGGIPWLRNLIVGENAPFGLIQDTLELLGYMPFLIKP